MRKRTLKKLAAGILTTALLAAGLLAGCTPEESGQEASNPADGRHPSGIHFTDISEEAGLGDFRHYNGAFGEKWFPEAMGAGGGFIDYNNNGLLDILLVGGGSFEGADDGKDVRALVLYRNNGDGTFTDVTSEAGLGSLRTYSIGISVADYNNSGWDDIFVTTLGRDLLFRNEDGVFTEVGRDAGITGEDWTTSAIFFDADNNGHLDLYVGGYVEWSPETDLFCSLDNETKGYCTPEIYPGIPGRFYSNNGDGTFTDRTEEAGFLNNPGKTLGIAEYDFNRNGYPDLFVANDTQRDMLYVNNGDGTFTERGALSGIAYDPNGRARAGMGIDVGVIESGGEPTMFVTNFSKEMIGVYTHMGNGLFMDRAAPSRIGRPSLMTLGFGTFLFDVDHNGFLDLFVANGHVQDDIEVTQEGITHAQKAHLFINQKDASFSDIVPELGGVWDTRIVGRGAAYGDINGNGRIDILITENNGRAYLWRNDSDSGHNYLRVHLQGTESNKDGIGSTVSVEVGDLKMERRVRTGSSYLSNSEKTVTFGIGEHTTVDALVVQWPGGRTEEFFHVEGNQELLLVEGTGELVPNARESVDAFAAGLE